MKRPNILINPLNLPVLLKGAILRPKYVDSLIILVCHCEHIKHQDYFALKVKYFPVEDGDDFEQAVPDFLQLSYRELVDNYDIMDDTHFENDFKTATYVNLACIEEMKNASKGES